MNEIDAFALERISQALEDLKTAMLTDIMRPEKLLYRSSRMSPDRESELAPFGYGNTWGGFDEWGWFRCVFSTPECMDGKELWIEIAQDKELWYAQNPQFLLYCNGEALQGLDVHHTSCMLRRRARAEEVLRLDFDSWAGMVTRDRTWSDKENRPGTFALRLFCVEPRVRSLYYDLQTPYETLRYIGRESRDGIRIERALEQAVDVLDFRVPGSEAFYESVEQANAMLKSSLYKEEAACQMDSDDGNENENTPTAVAVGHTHIDVAWMWQFAHTKEKVQRSFATALKLLEEYPQYVFMSSQPQIYEYMSQNQPRLFERIRDYVREGRWEVEGGMWVEADCNLTSGESLVRQFLIGKQYIKDVFGVDSRVLWLPDVFGYSAAMPQICRQCGIDYFMTTKISWNEMDKIPFDTFLWKGIDGSEILTHFAPAKPFNRTDYNPFGFARSPHITTYNGVLEPDYVMGGWKRYSQKKLNSSFLFPYGYGDGGGGTTREMIEKGIRMEKGIPGCPKVEFNGSRAFFEGLEKEVSGKRELPRWEGELYLEFHRGVYTSAAIVKRMNRKAENQLQQTEFLLCMAMNNVREFSWDISRWKEMLKKLLTNQFHDILPGSALTEVYQDVSSIYEEIFQTMDGEKQRALSVLNSYVPAGHLGIINSLGFDRSGLVHFSWDSQAPALLLTSLEGEQEAFPAQRTTEGTYVAWISRASAGGLLPCAVREETAQASFAWDGKTMETPLLRVCFCQDGTLESVWDKEEEREILSGYGNQMETYEDRPYQYDAWEISPYYRRKEYGGGRLVSMELTENGSVRACIRQKRQYLSSTICQDIYFYRCTKRIDFHTTIDWKENHILLKVAFPVDILASRAVYEIQFGTVERPTHTNTSWEMEQFETCAQRFADLAEPDYGAALLNDCKYGYDVHDGVLRLTLLRSPVFPNNVDTRQHEFTYSFMPHKGDYRDGRVQEAAYDLNNPLVTVCGTGSGQRSARPLIACSDRGIFTETVKPAEDGKGFIVRAYEGFGCRREASFMLGTPADVFACNMLEENQENLALAEQAFRVHFKPFEIKTFRIV
ncbi:MAG: glycosyl hydrolase-related protein [Clostridiales bacterium]|nr:glycosyl hydrolase-related protein [Clostridiales bacterium]